MAKTINELTDLVVEFNEARAWGQFHTPKDLAIAIATEAAEVLEHYRFRENYNPEEVGYELADVMIFTLAMAHQIGIDLEDFYMRKLNINDQKYPVEKAYGNNLKYTELE